MHRVDRGSRSRSTKGSSGNRSRAPRGPLPTALSAAGNAVRCRRRCPLPTALSAADGAVRCRRRCPLPTARSAADSRLCGAPVSFSPRLHRRTTSVSGSQEFSWSILACRRVLCTIVPKIFRGTRILHDNCSTAPDGARSGFVWPPRRSRQTPGRRPASRLRRERLPVPPWPCLDSPGAAGQGEDDGGSGPTAG